MTSSAHVTEGIAESSRFAESPVRHLVTGEDGSWRMLCTGGAARLAESSGGQRVCGECRKRAAGLPEPVPGWPEGRRMSTASNEEGNCSDV